MTIFFPNKFIEFFVTSFYVGKLKYCPGTFGSLIAFPLCYLIVYFVTINNIIIPFSNFNLVEAQLATFFIITLIICIMLFISGVYFTSIYIQYVKKEDPKEVVIDEVVGQMLAIILSFFSIILIKQSQFAHYLGLSITNLVFLFILPFGLFRFFDIVKPWPINWVDSNVRGGIGVMLDDVIAGLFAAILQYVITFSLMDWFG